MLIILFGFKMGDIRTHFLSDKNSLRRRKREAEAAEKENPRRQNSIRRQKGMDPKHMWRRNCPAESV